MRDVEISISPEDVLDQLDASVIVRYYGDDLLSEFTVDQVVALMGEDILDHYGNEGLLKECDLSEIISFIEGQGYKVTKK